MGIDREDALVIDKILTIVCLLRYSDGIQGFLVITKQLWHALYTFQEAHRSGCGHGGLVVLEEVSVRCGLQWWRHRIPRRHS